MAGRLRGRRAVDRRKRVLQRTPLCVTCSAGQCPHMPGPPQRMRKERHPVYLAYLATGHWCVREAVVADHKQPLHQGGPDTVDNLQGLCQDCHDLKSAREAHSRADSDKPPPQVIGRDGWPVERTACWDLLRRLLVACLVDAGLYPVGSYGSVPAPPTGQHRPPGAIHQTPGGSVPDLSAAAGNRTPVLRLFPQILSEYFTACCRRILHILITGKHIWASV